MEEKKEITKGRKSFWLVIGVVLFVSYFTLIGVLVYFQNGRTHYLDGLNGTFNGIARHFLLGSTLADNGNSF